MPMPVAPLPKHPEIVGVQIARELGLHYDGVQNGVGMQFTDLVRTETTFYGNTLAEVKKELAEHRQDFAEAGWAEESVPMSVIAYDIRYTLWALREMAKEKGLSTSGSKKEIAARLIARRVK